MPTFSSVGAFARELDKLDRDIERRRRDMGRTVAEAVKPEGYRAAAADLGGDPKFSGWRPWLELQVKSKTYGAAILPTRVSAGPWTVAESGRNNLAGPIPRRTRGGGVRVLKSGTTSVIGRRRNRRWNGVTAGKGTATEATSRFERSAKPVAEREFKMVLRKHFTVT